MDLGWDTLGKLAGAVTSTALAALAAASPALADTTIGQTVGNQACAGGFVAADAHDQVPAGGGLITSFSYGDNAGNAGAQLDFEALRPNADGSYTIVGHTGLQTLAGTNGAETFAADIPVSGGELLGYYETGTDNCLEKGTNDQVPAQRVGSDPSTGTTLYGMGASPIQGASLNESANLAPPNTAAPITATGSPVSGTEGQQLTGPVATFSDPDDQPAAAYAATISWGDGSSSAGTVSKNAPGQYEVDGSHTYAEEGSYPISVQISDQDGTVAQATSSGAVGDGALWATGSGTVAAPVTTTPSFAGPVATLTDANAAATAGDFIATIDWGDGTTSSGTVNGSGGSYTVEGSHSYGADGPYAVQVQVADAGGQVATATTQLLVFEYADQSGGSFVIGDGASGPQVYFWGAQWAAQNPLSGGQAPSAFKGFATSSAQSCGGTFTAAPGSSSSPPGSVPAYMAVAVGGSASKSGGDISGTVERIVVVKTDGGYGPAPGSPGTGQIVATVCG